MPTNLTLLDRLRIEGRVWALDQQLYDLPRKQRIATRREVRSNVVSAARSVGTRRALTNLGTTKQLAEEYLQAQFGPAPRASWLSAAIFFLTAMLVLTSLLNEAAQAFGNGILAASPHVTGHFSWHGIAYLQTGVEYTLNDGRVDFVGGALAPLSYLLLVLGAVGVGQLWRLLPGWRRDRRGADQQ